MKNLKFTLLSCILFACVNLSFGQKLVPIKDVNEIKKYDQLLVEKYPSFFEKKIVTDIYKLDDTYSRIEYNDNGVLTEELVYHRDNKSIIIAKSVLIAEKDVPGPVKDAFAKSANSNKEITGYFEVSPTYSASIYYAVEYNDDGDKKRAYFSRLGFPKDRPK
jgi:hypothetical protein